jgi:hypothetical protein
MAYQSARLLCAVGVAPNASHGARFVMRHDFRLRDNLEFDSDQESASEIARMAKSASVRVDPAADS